jgi:CRP-like cAMP-binding protein
MSVLMPTSLPENRLLAALPPADLSRLLARMTDVVLGQKDLLYSTGGPLAHVYFPRSGLISAVLVMMDGQTAEVAAVGREGMLGVATFLGATISSEQVFCQVHPAECRRLSSAEFIAEVAQGGALRSLVYRYTRSSMIASSRSTACNALHPIDERCARWLLMCHDRAGLEEFPLTHEFLATMLGVRRATVTMTAASFQSSGIITYKHGRVRILDRARLEEASCECYFAIRNAFEIPPS